MDARVLIELVSEAMRLPQDEDLAFLRARCTDPADLAKAEELLRTAKAIASRDGREHTKAAPPPRAPPGMRRLAPRTHVGPFVITGHLGSGSFGEVYRAERAEPPRKVVALKILRGGAASAADLDRFLLEAELLSKLKHSCIAHLIEAGSADGQEYIAMEYVEGSTITVSCNERRRSIEERIALVIRICGAVLHAHKASIIHRDLKPANILVTDEDRTPVPKVIDFGVAKLMNQPGAGLKDPTLLGCMVGTRDYMPPEQAKGSPEGVTTSSDIYSLGVVLYVLLSGTLPFDFPPNSSQAEVEGIISDVPAPRPSRRYAALLEKDPVAAREIARDRGLAPEQLIRRLSRDLDWIVLKCLEKDPMRRYEMANELADDLRRHLAFKPIGARPPSMLQRTRLFARRHRVAVTSGTILAVAIPLVATLLITDAIERNRQRAPAALEKGRRLLLTAAWEERPDVDEARISKEDSQASLAAARASLEKAKNLDPSLIEARALLVHASVLGGDLAEASRQAQDLEHRFPGSPDAIAAKAFLAAPEARGEMGPPTRQSMPTNPERDLYYRALVEEDPSKSIPLLELCTEMSPFFLDARALLAARRRELEDFAGMLGDASLLTRARPDLALSWSLQGSALLGLGRDSDAAAAFSRAIEAEPGAWRTHYERALALHRLQGWTPEMVDLETAMKLAPGKGRLFGLRGDVHYSLGCLSEAIADYDRAIELGERGAWVFQGRGEAFRLLEEPARALPDLDLALSLISTNARLRARVLRSRGTAFFSLGRNDEAMSDLVEACSLDPASPWAHHVLARCLARAGRLEDALQSYDTVLNLDPASDAEYERAMTWSFLGRSDEALPVLARWAAKYPWIYLWVWDVETARSNGEGARVALDAAEIASPPDDPAFAAVVNVLRGRQAPMQVNLEELSPTSRLYCCYILGGLASAEGRREEAIAFYKRGVDLGIAREFESDILAFRLRTLTEASAN